MKTVIAKIVDEDELVKSMVDRFLSWRLPEDFSPDAGISFKAEYNGKTWHQYNDIEHRRIQHIHGSD